jgi:hypothetical protein
MIETAAATESSVRGPGCDERCAVATVILPGMFGRSELLVHHPDPHEAYGRLVGAHAGAGAERASSILTGRLRVDLASLGVFLDGRPIRVTSTELRVLVALARSVGTVLEYADVIRLAWGPEMERLPRPSSQHVLRVLVARLRARLGDEAFLIRTVHGIGLYLDAVPVGQPARPLPWDRRARSVRPWAAGWLACVRCGSCAFPHAGHGYCTACRDHADG